jgi:hypothetical protein
MAKVIVMKPSVKRAWSKRNFPHKFTGQERILSTIVRAYCATQYDWRL